MNDEILADALDLLKKAEIELRHSFDIDPEFAEELADQIRSLLIAADADRVKL